MQTALILLVAVAVAYAQFGCQENPGKVTCTTPRIQVVIEGNLNVPKFTVTRTNDTQSYKVQFTTAWQTASDSSLQKIGGTNLALASYSWTLGRVVATSSELTFVLTGTGSPSFEFGISIPASSSAMKFNVTIDRMNGLWASDAKFMVLCYKVIQQGSSGSETNPAPTTDSSTRASFGAGYFSIVPTAKDNTGATRNVQLRNTHEGNANSLCTIYDKFDTKLVHDPTLGINSVGRAAFSFLVLAIVLLLNFF